MPPPVAVVLGTYNRLTLLQACVASLRRSVGALTYQILVADGGSTDGSRAWLMEQRDCELLEGGLEGAVKAFNIAFARAVEIGAPYIVQFNDDFECTGPYPEIACAVTILETNPMVGAVALESQLRGEAWDCERYHNLPMCTQSVIRRAAGMAAARAEGDPTGTAWWSPKHHTYASDTVLSCWIWRLGWEIRRGTGLRVVDHHCQDGLRERNTATYLHGPQSTVGLFAAQWTARTSLDYSRADAERFGGVIR